MRSILVAAALLAAPVAANSAPIEAEVEAAAAAVREASAGEGAERLGHALRAVRDLLDRVQDLVARRKPSRARVLLPELHVRVECVRAARRVLDLEDRARALEEEALSAERDASVAKDAHERAIEVRRELEAAP